MTPFDFYYCLSQKLLSIMSYNTTTYLVRSEWLKLFKIKVLAIPFSSEVVSNSGRVCEALPFFTLWFIQKFQKLSNTKRSFMPNYVKSLFRIQIFNTPNSWRNLFLDSMSTISSYCFIKFIIISSGWIKYIKNCFIIVCKENSMCKINV